MAYLVGLPWVLGRHQIVVTCVSLIVERARSGQPPRA
jgi:hypothetical protein